MELCKSVISESGQSKTNQYLHIYVREAKNQSDGLENKLFSKFNLQISPIFTTTKANLYYFIIERIEYVFSQINNFFIARARFFDFSKVFIYAFSNHNNVVKCCQSSLHNYEEKNGIRNVSFNTKCQMKIEDVNSQFVNIKLYRKRGIYC
jgi:hypothetical protein